MYFVTPIGSFDLVSSDQLNTAGYSIFLDSHNSSIQTTINPGYEFIAHEYPVKLPIETQVTKFGKLDLLPLLWEAAHDPPHGNQL